MHKTSLDQVGSGQDGGAESFGTMAQIQYMRAETRLEPGDGDGST